MSINRTYLSCGRQVHSNIKHNRFSNSPITGMEAGTRLWGTLLIFSVFFLTKNAFGIFAWIYFPAMTARLLWALFRAVSSDQYIIEVTSILLFFKCIYWWLMGDVSCQVQYSSLLHSTPGGWLGIKIKQPSAVFGNRFKLHQFHTLSGITPMIKDLLTRRAQSCRALP